MEKLDVKYFRYTDDILILAPTRRQLKRAIPVSNRAFDQLKLENVPDKTSMEPIGKGFDFLGHHFSPDGLTLAQKYVDNSGAKALRLYELPMSAKNKTRDRLSGPPTSSGNVLSSS